MSLSEAPALSGIPNSSPLLQSTPPGLETSNPRRRSYLDVLAIWGIVAVLTAFHLASWGPVPTGADPGNWLALARRLSAPEIMSADVIYPPLFPLLLSWLVAGSGPIVGLVLSLVISITLLVAGVFAAVRRLGRLWSVVGALVVGTAGYQLESVAWGGYPQLLATGLALMTLCLAVSYARSGRTISLLGVVLGSLLVALTHQLITGLLVLAEPLAVAASLPERLPWRERLRRGLVAVLATAVPCLILIGTWILQLEEGVRPVLNPEGRGVVELLYRTIWEAPVAWGLVAAAALYGLVSLLWDGRGITMPVAPPPVAMGMAWLGAGLVFFIVTHEQRALLLVQIGVILLALAGLRNLTEPLRPKALPLLMVGLVALGWVVIGGVRHEARLTSWYRVVDVEELEALSLLQRVSEPGVLVLASRGRYGNPIGWWVEGYAARPTFSGLDARFAAFPEERWQARLANRFFRDWRGSTFRSSVLDEIAPGFIVVDRRGPDGSWLQWSEGRYLLHPSFRLVYDSPTVVILEVKDPSPRAAHGAPRAP